VTLLSAGIARAQVEALPIDPAHAAIEFRSYAFGLMPIDGAFTQFSGTLTIDPRSPAHCHISVNVDVASLRMDDPAIRDDVLSATMLDARDFPTMAFDGICRDDRIEGTLTLHGVARPVRLAVTNEPPRYSADTMLHRSDWGIVGRPVLAGPNVRIRVSTTLSGLPAAAR
jgi:polyisoprenoid-binding protein YceI